MRKPISGGNASSDISTLGPEIQEFIAAWIKKYGMWATEDEILKAFQERASGDQVREALLSLQRDRRIVAYEIQDRLGGHKGFASNIEQLRRLHLICPECDSLRIIIDLDRGERVCESCGEVVSSKIDAIQRGYTPYTKSGIDDEWLSIASLIPRGVSISNSKMLTLDYRGRKAYRYLPTSKRILFHHDRTYREHLNFVEIDRICQKLNTPRWIKIEAARLSVKVLDLGAKMRPLARTTIMTAVVFAAYRIHNVAIDIGQICQTPSWKKEVLRAYRKLHELEIVSPTVIRPQQCVDPIILALKEEFAARGISRAEVERVTRLHDKAVAKLRTWRKLCEGRSPFVSAALAIYESAKECGIDAPIRRVAKAAKVSPESISRLHGVLAPLQSVP